MWEPELLSVRAQGHSSAGMKLIPLKTTVEKIDGSHLQTDPKNTDYELEGGATRNFEALRTAEMMAQREIKEKEEEEKNNPMKVKI